MKKYNRVKKCVYTDHKYVLKLAQTSSLSLLAIVLSTSAVHAKQNIYVGADIGKTYSGLRQEYGGEIFNNDTTSTSIYFGYYYARWLGIEVGYEKARTQNYIVYVPAAFSQFGIPNFTTIASSVYNTTQKYSGCSLLYVPKIKLHKYLDVIPLLGVVHARASFDLNLAEFDGASATSQEQANYYVHFATAKYIPKFGIRAQINIMQNYGVNLYYSWEQTSKLVMQTNRNIFPRQTLTAKLKNSNSLGVGLVYKFNL